MVRRWEVRDFSRRTGVLATVAVVTLLGKCRVTIAGCVSSERYRILFGRPWSRAA